MLGLRFMCLFIRMSFNFQNYFWNHCSSFFFFNIKGVIFICIYLRSLHSEKCSLLARFQSPKLLNCNPTFAHNAHLCNFFIWAKVKLLYVRCPRWQPCCPARTMLIKHSSPNLPTTQPSSGWDLQAQRRDPPATQGHVQISTLPLQAVWVQLVPVTWHRNFGNTTGFG